MTLTGRTLFLLAAGSLACAPGVSAQRWGVDLYAGGTRYEALASHAAAANMIGNLRYETTRLSAYLSAAAPLDDDAPVWSALGGRARPSIAVQPALRLGIDLAGAAYAFRQRDGMTGSGLSMHALPVISISNEDLLVELRAGRHDHVFRTAGSDDSRRLYEVAARGSIGTNDRYAILDVRSLYGEERTFPMVRLQLGGTAGPARVWASAGRWFGDDLAESIWDAGASVEIGRRGELWASVRRDAADPLYVSVPRTAWNVGYSLKLGGAADPLVAPLVRSGSLVLRLPLEGGAAPSVAGEFSEWQPLPMRASGDAWVLEIPVTPGVYRFAFVSAAGEWFVPDGYPGRMSDDMGGHVAVVVVP